MKKLLEMETTNSLFHANGSSEEENDMKNEIEQIETWTQMKVGYVIFDSDVDNWKLNTSVFDQKLKNKSNLLFLIEDNRNNIFGGYFNEKIDRIGWLNDPQSFIFSLKSNGRLSGMVKFDILNKPYSFIMGYKSYEYLFLFGNGDICVYKENRRNESYCNQHSFDYNSIQSALCGKKYFSLTRVTIIQMV